MFIEEETRWEFFPDSAGLWRWIIMDDFQVVYRSSGKGFITEGDAIKDAERYGYREPVLQAPKQLQFQYEER